MLAEYVIANGDYLDNEAVSTHSLPSELHCSFVRDKGIRVKTRGERKVTRSEWGHLCDDTAIVRPAQEAVIKCVGSTPHSPLLMGPQLTRRQTPGSSTHSSLGPKLEVS